MLKGSRLIVNLRAESLRLRSRAQATGTGVELTTLRFDHAATATFNLSVPISSVVAVEMREPIDNSTEEFEEVDGHPDEFEVESPETTNPPDWLADWRTEFDPQLDSETLKVQV